MRWTIIVLLAAGCDRATPLPGPPDGAHAITDGSAADLLGPTRCPQSNPGSIQVTIGARNDTTSDRFVVIDSCSTDNCGGNFQSGTGNCTSFGISDGFGPVPLHLRTAIQCEGPPPPTVDPGGYHRLKPGDQMVVGYWSASRLVTCERAVDCGPVTGAIGVLDGYLEPAAAGDYTVTIPVEKSLPAWCVGGPDDFPCGRNGGFGAQPGVMDRCASTATASAKLSLAGSDLVVIVPIAD